MCLCRQIQAVVRPVQPWAIGFIVLAEKTTAIQAFTIHYLSVVTPVFIRIVDVY